MAKKAKAATKEEPQVSRSQVIREYDAKHPGQGVKEVVAGLKAKGVEVSENLIYTVRAALKGKAAAKPAAKKAAPAAGAGKIARTNAAFTETELLQAKNLANELGGIERAQEVLGTLKKIL